MEMYKDTEEWHEADGEMRSGREKMAETCQNTSRTSDNTNKTENATEHPARRIIQSK